MDLSGSRYLRGSIRKIIIIFLFLSGVYAPQNSFAQKTAEEFYTGGILKLRKLDFTGAIDEFSKAIEIKPNFGDAYLKRGSAKDGLEDYRGAIIDYNKAIEIRPNWSDAYLSRGFAKYFLKDFDGGCADFSKAGRLGDTSAYSFVRQYCKSEYIKKEAEEYYKDGVTKFNAGNFEDCIVDLTTALSINGAYGDALFYRGRAKSKLGDFRGAIKDYSKVIELNPTTAKAYYNRGNARYEIEDYENSVYDFTKAIKLDPSNSASYFNRGNAKYKLGEKESACQDFSRAGELGDSEAYKVIKKYCK